MTSAPVGQTRDQCKRAAKTRYLIVGQRYHAKCFIDLPILNITHFQTSVLDGFGHRLRIANISSNHQVWAANV